MRQEQLVCSFKYAKRLKDLNITQDSYFYWDTDVLLDAGDIIDGGKANVCSAFTATELAEFYPSDIWITTAGSTNLKKKKGFFQFVKVGHDYKSAFFIESSNGDAPIEMIRFTDRNEADTRAQLLIYLIENKILDLDL